MAKLADLYLVGTGIYGLSQITLETRDIIKRCRRVFDLTHQHRFMKKLNPTTVDLDPCYWTGEEREVVYERLVEMVLAAVAEGPGVALVTYGHPLFFDDVNMELMHLLRRQGYDCAVLPAVSCLDTLSIDLEIDYGDGLQLYEAGDMVVNRQPLNPSIHTLILQIGEFGYGVTGDSAAMTARSSSTSRRKTGWRTTGWFRRSRTTRAGCGSARPAVESAVSTGPFSPPSLHVTAYLPARLILCWRIAEAICGLAQPVA